MSTQHLVISLLLLDPDHVVNSNYLKCFARRGLSCHGDVNMFLLQLVEKSRKEAKLAEQRKAKLESEARVNQKAEAREKQEAKRKAKLEEERKAGIITESGEETRTKTQKKGSREYRSGARPGEQKTMQSEGMSSQIEVMGHATISSVSDNSVSGISLLDQNIKLPPS